MICGVFVMGGMWGPRVWMPTFVSITMMVVVGCTLEASEPSMSPISAPEPSPDSLDVLIAVLREAGSVGVLSDETADLLSDLFIEYLITPETGEAEERVKERLSVDQPLDAVIGVLEEATVIGALSDAMSDLLSDLFIEYLIAPATGEAPEEVRGRLSAGWGTMTITNPDGSEITTMEQWSERVNSSHWKRGRSAYSLADFVMNRGGAKVLRERVSSVLSRPVTLDRATPEYGAKFDSHGGSPSKLDLGIFGRVGSESGLFVGVEAKVDEWFGETVCKRYQRAVSYLEENPRSKAAARVRDLLSEYFGETAEPCDSRFSDVRYQLLTSTAGTVAVGKDFSVFYVLVFETDSYDERRGRENRLAYERFIEAAGGRVIALGEGGFDAYEIMVAGKRLVCVYDYFDEWD